MFTQIVRLSFVDLRWAQLYVSLVPKIFIHVSLHVAVLGLSAVESNRRNIDLVLAPFCCISRSLFHCFAVSADRFGFKSFGSVLTPGRHLGCHLAQQVQPFLHIFRKTNIFGFSTAYYSAINLLPSCQNIKDLKSLSSQHRPSPRQHQLA